MGVNTLLDFKSLEAFNKFSTKGTFPPCHPLERESKTWKEEEGDSRSRPIITTTIPSF